VYEIRRRLKLGFFRARGAEAPLLHGTVTSGRFDTFFLGFRKEQDQVKIRVKKIRVKGVGQECPTYRVPAVSNCVDLLRYS
jgi:hypothetical protein